MQILCTYKLPNSEKSEWVEEIFRKKINSYGSCCLATTAFASVLRKIASFGVQVSSPAWTRNKEEIREMHAVG